ncbi:MAG: OsmC family protein [Acidobacteriota bacterium]|nr:OsmC family protein [Acidobacteriota bacterium]
MTHEYQATVSWTGSTGVGYDAYNRRHTVTAPPAQASLTLSSDPAFRGDPTLLTPEQLLVLAAASCQLLSFLAVAARARLDVVSYQDSAHAEMPEDVKPVHIARIVLRPVIQVHAGATLERLRHLSEVAHRECYIANSLKTEVIVEPTFHIL